MEEERSVVDEVIYETRHHASRPYVSNYPPMPTRINESGSGGFLSRISVIGISQLKQRWSDNKKRSTVKKPVSMFISSRGERVAIASGNHITILSKELDYQEPCGIFSTGENLGTFLCGTWSEPHDILGLIDDCGTLYFVKANGEEITRTTKKQLKLSSAILGLISQVEADAQGSCLRSFFILTANGFLHALEISRDRSAFITSRHTLNNELTAKREFPEDIICFDYDSECSLLVVLGNAALTSHGSSGTCHLFVWRKCDNLDLELLSTLQFKGIYCKPEDSAGCLTDPKVLLSPCGTFVATLDITGYLHIFKLDKQKSSVSLLAGKDSEAFSGIMDFTWWSDHIVATAKGDGTFVMLDILTAVRLQMKDAIQSVSVLERVKLLEGHMFLLQKKSSERKKLPSSSSSQNVEHEDTRNAYDISQLWWTLITITQRSIPEMYNILIGSFNYQAALDFANRHGLDREEVLKAQWLHSNYGVHEINTVLSNIKDRAFVISECVDKVGPTEDSVKALLAHGLRATDKLRFSASQNHEDSQTWDFSVARLQLLQFRDRLETYLGINMGRFSVQEYSKFRVMPLHETAKMLAESGKIGALNLLFKRHPYSLSPFLLEILRAVPETIPVQTYKQLLPGRSPPTSISLRDEDWVECEKMINFVKDLSGNDERITQIKTEPIVKHWLGYNWPSTDELMMWYKSRAIDIDCYSGLLDNCLCLVDFACQKGIVDLQRFHEDIACLHQLIYSDESESETCFNMSLVTWEQLSDYDKFKMTLKEVNEETVIKRLYDKAIPFMQKRSISPVADGQVADGHFSADHNHESFLVRWLKEIAVENKLEICLVVIEEGCRDSESNYFFKNSMEAIDCALQCVYMSTATDKWSTMAAMLSKLPQRIDDEVSIKGIDKRRKLAEGHIEAGRLLTFYQVPKPISFFLEAHTDEKGVKQIFRLILSKFVRKQPSRSDNDWATMWRDLQCLREKAFPFVDPEYMLTEFCRGLLKAGKFSLARNYLKGTSSVALAPEKAENLVIQAAREYFFSASSLSCSEIWKAKECLNLFPNSRNVKAEGDVIDALTVKLPTLGVTLLPMQFKQITDPMEIIKKAITSQAGAYMHVDELIDVAKLLGLKSSDDLSAVEEAIAREAAVAGDLQLAFDLCLVLAKKGHGQIWDLCAAIARGPATESMDESSRKHLLGFALTHCDEESIAELLHAWKDFDMHDQCENLLTSEMTSPNFSVDSSSVLTGDNEEYYFNNIKRTLSLVAKNLPVQSAPDVDSFLRDNGKISSFATSQLPWLLSLSNQTYNGKRQKFEFVPGKQYGVCEQALVTILSWLARNGFAPRDDVVASLAKLTLAPPVTEEEDIVGCSFLLNLVDAFNGVEVIEEQLRIRERYQEICSIMNVGMSYSLLHNSSFDCKDPNQRRELLLGMFKEKHTALSHGDINNIDEQSTFWKEWKLKLEGKKRVAEDSRMLEQIIPGVDTDRFLSGDSDYIEDSIFSLIESLKLNKKHIMKDVLKVADIYGINRILVLQGYLSSILVSEVWSNDDIESEISEVKEELLGYTSETIKTISLIVYPAIDGYNKQRLTYIYGLLSDSYLHLEKTSQAVPIVHPSSSFLSSVQFAHFYKLLDQECRRVSFIKDLNFKNIAELDGLNLQFFSNEVYAHINEMSLEPLAKLVQTLVSLYNDSVPESLISWKDVYKYYVLSLLLTLESRAMTECKAGNPENFQQFISIAEHTYDSCRSYIKLIAPSDALDIMRRYFKVLSPLHNSYGSPPDSSEWQECLIILLNFWLRLCEEMVDIVCGDCSEEKVTFDPGCLTSCVKNFMRLVIEDIVSPSQGWATVFGYISYGFTDSAAVEIEAFCRAMLYAGCGFGSISEVFLEAMSHWTMKSANSETRDISDLYLSMLEPLLRDLVDGLLEHQKIHHLLSSLSKMEGQIELLRRVRHVIWERMSRFCDDLQLPSHVRVYALELMQFIAGKNIKGFSTDLKSTVLPWEGWEAVLSTNDKSETPATEGLSDKVDTSSRLTSTLVALKSSQLITVISPGSEITPDDLLSIETAVSCFSKLCNAASTDPHFDALLAVLEEWEGYFATEREKEDTGEKSEVGNEWSNDGWDDDWETFQEDIESTEKDKQVSSSLALHPLHLCWMALIKKSITLSRFNDVIRVIDKTLSKSNGVLLDEGDARSIIEDLLEVDCFLGFKVSLLLPYLEVQLQCLGVIEEKLKGGISDVISRDHILLLLVLSSGIGSTIVAKSSYDNTFSYLCYLLGNFSRQSQEAEVARITQQGRKESHSGTDFLALFKRVLFPCYISELVKADQLVLAGFLVTKVIHTNDSFSLINIAEVSLLKYLERQLTSLQHEEFDTQGLVSCEVLKNTVSSLIDKSQNLIQTAIAYVSANAS